MLLGWASGDCENAAKLTSLFGLCGNGLFLFIYSFFPSMLRLVLRLRVGTLKFASWNLVISAPIVVLSVMGRLQADGAPDRDRALLISSGLMLYALLSFAAPHSPDPVCAGRRAAAHPPC